MSKARDHLNLPDENIAMIAATSILQQQAGDVRARSVNWASYFQSQMISHEEYEGIRNLDKSKGAYLLSHPEHSVKTFLDLLSHVSRESTIQYILVMIDDMLQEDRTRVKFFHEYAANNQRSVWAPFLNFLTYRDGFIINMSACILAKLACWGNVLMPTSDLNFYLHFLKDNLTMHSKAYIKEMAELVRRVQAVVVHQHGHGHGHGQGQSSDYSPMHEQQHYVAPNEIYREISSDDGAASGMRIPNNDYIQSVGRCLQMMLRVDEYRFAFVSVDGITALMTILSSQVNFQVQYQLIFCFWVLTFNPLLAAKMNKFSVIPLFADILHDCAKEKVTRIILAVFRNLIEKPQDPLVSKEHCIAMVQCKVLKHLAILEQRRFEDEDINADVEFITERLHNSVQDLSSFDEYATELRSTRLEWSPVHKSAKFWRENAQRLNDKNYELLRILIHLLETSKDTLVLSVACFDIGEYVRHYPRGKHVLEQLNGKQIVMQHLGHDDPNVRYEALLAVQKLMVHNWEYLGKQLEKEHEAQKQSSVPISGKA